MPYEMNTILIKIAEKKGMSKNSLMLQILWKWIEENKKMQYDVQAVQQK